MDRHRYVDRAEAGEILAAELGHYRGTADLLVLGLPRGGVPVAAVVARELGAELDVLVVRKIGVPGQPEVAMGAIASIAGSVETVTNDQVLSQLRHARIDPAFDSAAERELVELRRRQSAYRGERPPLRVAGRVVILVDDGLATGATMRAAVTACRQERPERIVVAVPIGLSGTCDELREVADEVVCTWTPMAFFAVGQGYVHFDQTTDDEVRELLGT